MKNSFVMYTNWLDMIAELDDKGRSELLMAIMLFQNGEDVPEDMSIGARVAFAQIKGQFIKDNEKYEEIVQKRKEAGKSGGLAKASKSQQVLASASKSKQSLANSRQNLANLADNDNDNVNDKDIKENTKEKQPQFTPPTVEDVKAYSAKQGYTLDAERFVDFYASKGWMVGKNKMRDWKAAVRNWAKTDKQEKPPNSTGKPKFTDFSQRQYEYGDLNKKLFGG